MNNLILFPIHFYYLITFQIWMFHEMNIKSTMTSIPNFDPSFKFQSNDNKSKPLTRKWSEKDNISQDERKKRRLYDLNDLNDVYVSEKISIKKFLQFLHSFIVFNKRYEEINFVLSIY